MWHTDAHQMETGRPHATEWGRSVAGNTKQSKPNFFGGRGGASQTSREPLFPVLLINEFSFAYFSVTFVCITARVRVRVEFLRCWFLRGPLAGTRVVDRGAGGGEQ